MKNIYLKFTTLLLVVNLIAMTDVFAQGQVIKSNPVITAVVGSQYIYNVNVFPVGDSTFVLTTGLDGMSMDTDNGLITWTPASINKGGLVVVSATVGGITSTQSFYVYVSDNTEMCDPGMISYWKLDETTGTTFLDSKGGYNAFTGVAPLDVPGMVNRAKFFDPDYDTRLSVADVDNQYDWLMGDAITGSVWFRSPVDINTQTGPQIFMGRLGVSGDVFQNHWWWFGLDTNNYVSFEASNDAGMKQEGEAGYPNVIKQHSNWGVHFENNTWHHAAFTLQTNINRACTVKIYVDGVLTLSATKTLLEGDFTSGADLNIGWWQNPWEVETFEYKGTMDEAVIYKRLLTGAEIKALYDKGIAGDQYCYSGNFAPLFKSQPTLTTNEDATYSYNIVTGDYETGSNLDIAVVSAPEWLDGFIDNGDGTATINGVPTNSDVGTHAIELSVTDGFATVNQTFDLEVVNVNDQPSITTSPVITGAANSLYQYWVETADDDDPQVTLEATVKPAWTTFSYNASTGVGLLSGTPVANTPRLNNVTLTVSDTHGGTATQQFVITVSGVISGFEDIPANENVKVYPSPARDFVYVETGDGFVNGKVQIMSISGVVIKDVTIDERTEKIDLSDMSHGVYFYKITGSDGEVTGKIIKE